MASRSPFPARSSNPHSRVPAVSSASTASGWSSVAHRFCWMGPLGRWSGSPLSCAALCVADGRALPAFWLWQLPTCYIIDYSLEICASSFVVLAAGRVALPRPGRGVAVRSVSHSSLSRCRVAVGSPSCSHSSGAHSTPMVPIVTSRVGRVRRAFGAARVLISGLGPT
jgi:hypothetical protein